MMANNFLAETCCHILIECTVLSTECDMHLYLITQREFAALNFLLVQFSFPFLHYFPSLRWQYRNLRPQSSYISANVRTLSILYKNVTICK
jgi:hypothetical protein